MPKCRLTYPGLHHICQTRNIFEDRYFLGQLHTLNIIRRGAHNHTGQSIILLLLNMFLQKESKAHDPIEDISDVGLKPSLDQGTLQQTGYDQWWWLLMIGSGLDFRERGAKRRQCGWGWNWLLHLQRGTLATYQLTFLVFFFCTLHLDLIECNHL